MTRDARDWKRDLESEIRCDLCLGKLGMKRLKRGTGRDLDRDIGRNCSEANHETLETIKDSFR